MEENNKLVFPGVWRVFVRELYLKFKRNLFDEHIVRNKDLGVRIMGNVFSGIYHLISCCRNKIKLCYRQRQSIEKVLVIQALVKVQGSKNMGVRGSVQ